MKNSKIVTISTLSILLFSLFMYFFSYKQEANASKIQTLHVREPIHLRFGHNSPSDTALHKAALRFADLVKAKTEGALIVDVIPSQQIGNDYQMVELARKGELDILLTPTAKMSLSVPSMEYADLPFYFLSRQDLYAMLDGEPGEMILKNMQSIGLIGVAFWENGFKHLTANFPILSPKDLQGKKIRVMKSRMIMEQFKSFGAIPLAIDFHRTKQALVDGVVDGEENPLIAIVSMGFYKVQSDLTLSEHAFLGYVLSFSEKSLEKLPNSFREILMQTAKEVTSWERKETQKREKQLLQIIQKSAVNIHTLSKEQRQEFAELVKHIPQEYEALIGADIISKTEELMYEKCGTCSENQEHILIGIDADVSIGGRLAGLEIKRGVALAVAEINAKGGLLGKPVKVILKDHKITSSIGLQNIQDFAKNPNLVAIIGGKHSAVISEEIKSINSLKIPYLIPWASAASLVNNNYKENYIFRVSANNDVASKFILKYLLQKYKKPAIMVENSLWGRENMNSMKKYLHSKGMKFTTEIVFNRGQANFDKMLKSIVKSGAESLIIVSDSFEGSKIVQALSKEKKKIPLISHWGMMGGDFFKENREALSKIDFSFFQTFSFSQKENQASQKLFKAYTQSYKTKKVSIDFAVAQAYDLTCMLALAIQKAGTTESSKVKEALESLEDYQGVIKTYAPAFTPTRHDALNEKDYYMAKFKSDGTIVPVSRK